MNTAMVHVSPDGTGTPLWMCGALYEVRLQDEHSANRCSVFKVTSPPHILIAPAHRHMVCDELLIILKGTVVSFTGEEYTEHILRDGDFIWLPRGTLEGFKTTDESAEMLWVMMPGANSELFFNLVAEPALCRDVPPTTYVNPSLAVLRDFSTRTGFQVVPGLRDDPEGDRIRRGTNAEQVAVG